MSNKTRTYEFDGDLLIYCGDPPPDGVRYLTVRNYIKWYVLYLIDSNGSVSTLSPYELEGYDSDGEWWSSPDGHCWNPNAIERWARMNGCQIDDVSYEVIVGRWAIEAADKWGMGWLKEDLEEGPVGGSDWWLENTVQ